MRVPARFPIIHQSIRLVPWADRYTIVKIESSRRKTMSFRKAVSVFILLFFAASMARAQSANGKSVIRLDPALDALVSADAQVELVKAGFGFAEGANWVQQGNTGYLLFSDIGANVIYKWTPDGKVTVFLDRSGYTGYDLWNNVGVD